MNRTIRPSKVLKGFFRFDRGSVLVTLVIFIAIISILLFAGTTLVVSGNKGVHAISTLKQAHYVAEAGIEEVLSNPFAIQYALYLYEKYNKPYRVSSQNPFLFEDNKEGTYEVTVTVPNEKTIRIESTGFIRGQNGTVPPEKTKTVTKTIVCELKLKEGSFYDIALENAVTTIEGLSAGKVYVYLDQGVSPNKKANVYSGRDITIGGFIPGSIMSQGNITVNLGTTVEGDVIAKGNITLNNNVKVCKDEEGIGGKVVSAGGWVYVNNNTKVDDDIVAYRIDDKGYAITLNKSNVEDLYTPNGKLEEVNAKNSSYSLIKPITPDYPEDYPVPEYKLPIITEEVKSLWIKQAQSDNLTYKGLSIGNNQTVEFNGNVYIDGDLVLNQNATLKIQEGTVVYVTGSITIENNALISVVDDGDSFLLPSSLITEKTFDIQNNAIPTSVSLIALGTGTSSFKNNSVTTGTILIPNGNLEIKNNAVIHGSIFANSISKMGNNATIYFNPSNNLSIPPTETNTKSLQMVRWLES